MRRTHLPTLPCLARGLVCLLVSALTGACAANPLQRMHEQALDAAVQSSRKAIQPYERRSAWVARVAALNSLHRTKEALALFDELPLDDRANGDVVDTKAKVLLAADRCPEALALLDPRLASVAENAANVTPRDLEIAVWGSAAEGFLAAMYCELSLGRPDAAVLRLERVRPLLDWSIMQYQAAWYAALRSLGAAPLPALEKWLAGTPRSMSVHRLSMDVARGQLSADEAVRQLGFLRLPPDQYQDGLAELHFFAGVLERATKGRTSRLAELEALAPYGSAEWLLARRLLAP